MSDVMYADARQENIKNLLSEALRDEVADEVEPQLELLKEKRDELKMLRRELKDSLEELREQSENLREVRRDAERVDQSKNSDDAGG